MQHRVALLRHAETLKNDLDIHGTSSLWQLTLAGVAQLSAVINALGGLRWLDGVTYFQTPQAEHFAAIVAERSGLPLEPPLSLVPFNLGVADGISTSQLRLANKLASESLSLFPMRNTGSITLLRRSAELEKQMKERGCPVGISEAEIVFGQPPRSTQS